MEPLHSQIRKDYPPAKPNQRSNFVGTLVDRGWQREVVSEDVRAVILPGQGWNPVEFHFRCCYSIEGGW